MAKQKMNVPGETFSEPAGVPSLILFRGGGDLINLAHASRFIVSPPDGIDTGAARSVRIVFADSVHTITIAEPAEIAELLAILRAMVVKI